MWPFKSHLHLIVPTLSREIVEMLLGAIQDLKNQLLEIACSKTLLDFSIYTGIAGIALSLWETGFVAEARSIILTRWNDALHSILNTRRKAQLITGPTGFMIVASLILSKISEVETKFGMALDTSVREIIQLCNDRSSPCEFLYGAAGGLYCVRFLRRISHQVSNIASLLNDLESQLVSKIIMEHQSGLGWPWHGEFYIGAAHGSAGILLQLLRTPLADQDGRIRGFVAEQVQLLITTGKYPDGGNFKSSVSCRRDRLVQWCHGAPGVALLLQEASRKRLLPSLELSRELEEALRVTSDRGLLSKWTGLCHGLAGNGLILLSCGKRQEAHKYVCIHV